MKKFIHFFSFIVLASLFVGEALFAQTLTNDKVILGLSSAGRVRLTDKATNTRQIDRFSPMVFGKQNQVFAYNADAEKVSGTDGAVTVESPTHSDFEAMTRTDNSYSSAPPNVEVDVYNYLWNNGSYGIIKFTVINKETTTETFRFGGEIIPQPAGNYGFELTDYDPKTKAFYFQSPDKDANVGFRLLNDPLSMFKTIDWYDGYDADDAVLYGHLGSGIQSTEFVTSTSDGSVMLFAGSEFVLEAGASKDFYVAVSYGISEKEMKESMIEAMSKYNAVFNLLAEGTTTLTNDKVQLSLTSAGRVRIYDVVSENRHIDRLSPLVIEGTKVFSYNEDADAVPESGGAQEVGSPFFSDFEAFARTNNSYSELPPNVEVDVNTFLWSTGNFGLVKYTVINKETTTSDFYFGGELIFILDGSYGFEINKFDVNNKIFYTNLNPASSSVGFKLLNDDLTLLKSIDWYDGYDSTDAEIYPHLQGGVVPTDFASGADGSVLFFLGNKFTLEQGASKAFYLAVAYGTTELEMKTGLTEAEAKYQATLSKVEKTNELIPTDYALSQNYPNPFNPTTKISFTLPERSNVSLKVYNVLGQMVSELVNSDFEAGNYTVDFNASQLSSGMYIYTLSAGNNLITKKMTLIK
ncbi:MAG: T9SS type A sorting domain-containing protein [Melioribacteraceae bacterium]|nr:T9SS type A sorting domain-containing protein [Melioribacteraceae bacterium]